MADMKSAMTEMAMIGNLPLTLGHARSLHALDLSPAWRSHASQGMGEVKEARSSHLSPNGERSSGAQPREGEGAFAAHALIRTDGRTHQSGHVDRGYVNVPTAPVSESIFSITAAPHCFETALASHTPSATNLPFE